MRTMEAIQKSVELSRRRILNAIGDAEDVTFLRGWGNIGDELIFAGTRQLLSTITYSERSIRDLNGADGDTALMSGSGGWCVPYHSMSKYLPLIEERYARVIVLPSSFDVRVPEVRAVLSNTRALVFAREQASYDQISKLCRCLLAHDCAFFFDFRPYRRRGLGVLNAFRTDREGLPVRPSDDNNDISKTCGSLDEWLWTIASYEEVRTDRAHVTIAAAVLGKRVFYRPSAYHKIPAIVAYALGGLHVEPLVSSDVRTDEGTNVTQESITPDADMPSWRLGTRRILDEVAELVPPGASYVLVDQNQLGNLPLPGRHAIPFLERGGLYWGPPSDDATAIRELERLREGSPTHLVIAWPALWWIEHYRSFCSHIWEKYSCVRANRFLIAFDLRKSKADLESGLAQEPGRPVRPEGIGSGAEEEGTSAESAR